MIEMTTKEIQRLKAAAQSDGFLGKFIAHALASADEICQSLATLSLLTDEGVSDARQKQAQIAALRWLPETINQLILEIENDTKSE